MRYHFNQIIGTREIMGTAFPMLAVAYGSKREYVSAVLVNGVAERVTEHKTKREAVERAREMGPLRPDRKPETLDEAIAKGKADYLRVTGQSE